MKPSLTTNDRAGLMLRRTYQEPGVSAQLVLDPSSPAALDGQNQRDPYLARPATRPGEASGRAALERGAPAGRRYAEDGRESADVLLGESGLGGFENVRSAGAVLRTGSAAHGCATDVENASPAFGVSQTVLGHQHVKPQWAYPDQSMTWW
jgi:hypothetical protein